MSNLSVKNAPVLREDLMQLSFMLIEKCCTKNTDTQYLIKAKNLLEPFADTMQFEFREMPTPRPHLTLVR